MSGSADALVGAEANAFWSLAPAIGHSPMALGGASCCATQARRLSLAAHAPHRPRTLSVKQPSMASGSCQRIHALAF